MWPGACRPASQWPDQKGLPPCARLDLSDNLHFHGLRHSAGKRLAEAGCTPQEIAAILGHKALGMVTPYTAQAGQEHLARAAITKLTEHNQKTTVNRSKK